MSGRSWSLLLSFHHIILFIMITSISEVWVPRPLSIASRCRAERRREHNNNLSVVINSGNNNNSNSSNHNSKCSNNNRIKCRISSSSFLTRPCALYLFTVLVILDLSDFNSGILISSFSNNGERTASSRGKSASDNNNINSDNQHEVYNSVVSTMSRHNAFLVNGAFNNKENYYYDHGLLGGLTDSPQVPSLSMDSLFFHHSVENQLTDSSESAEEQLENISRDEDDEFEDGDENNDRDSTDSVEISRTLEPQMLQRLESRFLKLFGMKKRPSAEASNKKQIKIPKYLLDLYQKQTGTELPTSNLNLPGRHTRTANTVRTFYHQQPGNPKESTGPWKGRENHIHFKLDSIPETEKVTGAELRIPFWITVDKAGHSVVSVQSGGSVRESNSVSDDERGELKAVRILIHDVMKPPAAASSPGLETGLMEPTSYPIDSKNVILSKRRNGTSSFWLTFDVFPAVARWMSNPAKNHGLVLEILGVTNEGHLVPQETVVQRHNLRVKRDVDDNDNHHDQAETESVVHVETSGSSGKGRRTESQSTSNSIITTDSSSTSEGSAAPSSKSTQDSGESLSESSKAQTPVATSSSVVQASSSSSPTEVGVAVAPDGGFINGFNEERNSVKKGKSFEQRKKAAASSSSIVLFTYSDDGHNPAKTRDAKTLSRHYRSAQAHKRRKNPRNKNRKRNLCQRHAMFVDFQDVGWNDWIVAPPGYAAYYCAGECPFPMAEHLNATNHAVIQALVHSMNPALVPPPCCVPTKYSSLSLLYTDSSDKIVLKNYNEMVVDSCGCS